MSTTAYFARSSCTCRRARRKFLELDARPSDSIVLASSRSARFSSPARCLISSRHTGSRSVLKQQKKSKERGTSEFCCVRVAPHRGLMSQRLFIASRALPPGIQPEPALTPSRRCQDVTTAVTCGAAHYGAPIISSRVFRCTDSPVRKTLLRSITENRTGRSVFASSWRAHPECSHREGLLAYPTLLAHRSQPRLRGQNIYKERGRRPPRDRQGGRIDRRPPRRVPACVTVMMRLVSTRPKTTNAPRYQQARRRPPQRAWPHGARRLPQRGSLRFHQHAAARRSASVLPTATSPPRQGRAVLAETARRVMIGRHAIRNP